MRSNLNYRLKFENSFCHVFGKSNGDKAPKFYIVCYITIVYKSKDFRILKNEIENVHNNY